jgi:hypothetical protein
MGSGRASFPSEKYHSNGDYLSGASREFMLFSQNTIEAVSMPKPETGRDDVSS